MSSYVLAPLARADLFEIWCYIAADKEDAADRVESAIRDACSFVASSPKSGSVRPGAPLRGLRFWTVTRYTNYTIVYRSETTPLEIIPVLHGKRNFRRVLKERL
jgi:plasmid stabilization system protein ParE